MTWPRGPLITKVLLVLLCLGVLSIYVVRVVEVYLAQSLADSTQGESRITGLERSIRLVPDDAEFPHLLGLRLSASDQDDARAIVNLRKAVTINPYRGHYWLDLAAVYQAAGDVEKEREAAQSAVDSEPKNPEIAEHAGQLFLASGDPDRAFVLFKYALEQNPDSADDILSLSWRETRDTKRILAKVVPANPELQLAFLRVLTQQDERVAANEVWQSIVATRKSFKPQLSFFYFNYLLQEQDVAGFDRNWHALAALSPEINPYLPMRDKTSNLMVNGGFELPLLNSGFDWRYQTADHISVTVDDRVAHSGTHSLSLSFDGNPSYDAGWTQFVPVQPDAEYEFTAWIKSKDVTTSSGPRIALADAFSGAQLLLTDDVLDTHPWQEIRGTLRVPAETQLLAVKIVRAPANTRIRGQIWIDDLRLTKR